LGCIGKPCGYLNPSGSNFIDGNKGSYNSANNNGILVNNGQSKIEGNTCGNNSGSGIRFNSYILVKDSLAIRNTCNDNDGNGIDTFSNSEIVGNICNNNSTGIRAADKATVTGNICNGNSACGILISNYSVNTDAAGTVCTGNTCIDNNTAGIRITFNANHSMVSGNVCSRGAGAPGDYTSSQYTIFVESSATDNLVVGNIIMGKNYVNNGGATNVFANNKYN